MSQVTVQWVEQSDLDKYPHDCSQWNGEPKMVPVIPLADLREVVEGLKRIQKLAKQDHTGPLDPFGDLIRIEDVAQRLLASLGEVEK